MKSAFSVKVIQVDLKNYAHFSRMRLYVGVTIYRNSERTHDLRLTSKIKLAVLSTGVCCTNPILFDFRADKFDK